MNPMALVKIKPLLSKFKQRHPKFFKFFFSCLHSADEGSLVTVKLTTSDGKESFTTLKIGKEDMELIDAVKKIL